MRARIKIVPENEPNADGVWISWKIPGYRWRCVFSSETGPKIGPKGFVVVSYGRPRRRKHPMWLRGWKKRRKPAQRAV